MTPTVTVIGSGASGVHFALTLLRKGVAVRMLDVGRQAGAPVLPEATLNGLKAQLPDPVGYFLGADFGSALLPGVDEEYYGLPRRRTTSSRHRPGSGMTAAGSPHCSRSRAAGSRKPGRAAAIP